MIVEFVDEVCGLYFRSVLLAKAGDRVGQHTHDHDHATYCGSGSATLYVDGVLTNQCIAAGSAVAVLAGRRHEFIAREDNTRLTCVHDAASAQSIKDKGL